MTVEERVKKTREDFEEAKKNMPDIWSDEFFPYWEKFDEEHEERAVAARILRNIELDADDCRKLCELAEIEDEWDAADEENFERVVYKAAKILNVPAKERSHGKHI